MTITETDRSLWLAQVLRSHPEVLEMRERIRGISGVATFNHSMDISISTVSCSPPLFSFVSLIIILIKLLKQGLFWNSNHILANVSFFTIYSMHLIWLLVASSFTSIDFCIYIFFNVHIFYNLERKGGGRRRKHSTHHFSLSCSLTNGCG